MISKTVKRLNNEIRHLHNNPLSWIRASEDDFDIRKWKVTIKGPEGTPYESGYFNCKLSFPNTYPLEPPDITFITKIFHVNFHYGSELCCDSNYKNNWSPTKTSLDIFNLFIIY